MEASEEEYNLEQIQLTNRKQGEQQAWHIINKKIKGHSSHGKAKNTYNCKTKLQVNKDSFQKKIYDYLTRETLHTAVQVFRFASLIKCVPFELDTALESSERESLRVRMFRKRWQLLLWHIVNWIVYILAVYRFISFYFIFHVKKKVGEEMAVHIAYLIHSMADIVFLGAMHMKPKECIRMLNQHDFIFTASPGHGMGNRHWASHPFVILGIYYMSRMVVLVSLAFVGMILWKPERPAYIYSIFPEPWKQNYIFFIFCFIIEAFWFVWGLTMLIIYFCYWCADVFTINTALSELMRRTEVNEVDIEAYVYLQIFCVLFNDYNANYFAPGFCFMLVTTPVFFIFISLTCYHSLNIFTYLVFPLVTIYCVGLIVAFLPQHSKVRILSQSLLDHMKAQKISPKPCIWDDIQFSAKTGQKMTMMNTLTIMQQRLRVMYLKKKLRALKPIGFQIWFFGPFTLGTSLSMTEQLFNNVLLLLSL